MAVLAADVVGTPGGDYVSSVNINFNLLHKCSAVGGIAVVMRGNGGFSAAIKEKSSQTLAFLRKFGRGCTDNN